MTPDNWTSLAVFAGTLLATFLGLAAWDVWIYLRKGADATISRSVQRLTVAAPFGVILFVFAFGLVVGGLFTHFWFWQPTPCP